MSKNKEELQNVITENFVNEKIDVDRFLKMFENVEKISEEKAEKLLSEVDLNNQKMIKGQAIRNNIRATNNLQLKIAAAKKAGNTAEVERLTKGMKNLNRHGAKLLYRKGGKIALGAAAVGGVAYALKKRKQNSNTESFFKGENKMNKIFTEIKQKAQEKIIESQSITSSQKLSIITEISQVKEGKESLILAGGVLSYAAILAMLVAAQDRFFTYYGKKCKGLKDGKDRRICKLNAKIEAHKHEASLTKSMMTSHCPKTKNPEKCKTQLTNRLNRLVKEINRLEKLKKDNKHDFKSALNVGNRAFHPAD